MTRRSERYIRRKNKRLKRRAAAIQAHDNFDNVCNRQNLFIAADLAKKHVLWKGTVQRWSIEQLLWTEKLYRDLKAGKDVRKGFSRFTICERGKRRNISAVKFYERVVQKCLCHNILCPVYSKSMIYDNSASQKGKGVKFAGDRIITALRRHYRRFGTNGYALLVDFKGYFENIDHEELKKIYRQKFKDAKIIKLTDDFVNAYGDKGLGLGSETNQMHAIYYPNRIDHDVTEHCKGAFYGRYMDDSFVIAHEKKTILKALGIFKRWCEKLKITLSPKKTVIVKISAGINWLKTKYYLLKNGKIIKKPCRKSVAAERRKLKRQIKVLKAGGLSLPELRQSFESWAGSMKRRNARLSVWKMRQLLWSNLL